MDRISLAGPPCRVGREYGELIAPALGDRLQRVRVRAGSKGLDADALRAGVPYFADLLARVAPHWLRERDRGLIVENTSRHLAHQWIDDGLGIRSNHFTLPEAQAWIARPPDANTLTRYQRACELIESHRGRATSERFARVSRDHSAGPDSICSDNREHFWMTLSAFTHTVRREHTSTLTVTWICNGHTRNACYFPVHLSAADCAADLVSGEHNAPSWRMYERHGCGDHLAARQDRFESAARKQTAEVEQQALELLRDGKPEEARALLAATYRALAERARIDDEKGIEAIDTYGKWGQYFIAREAAAAGDSDRAFDALRRALNHWTNPPLTDVEAWENDAYWGDLREHPEYKRIYAEKRQRIGPVYGTLWYFPGW